MLLSTVKVGTVGVAWVDTQANNKGEKLNTSQKATPTPPLIVIDYLKLECDKKGLMLLNR